MSEHVCGKGHGPLAKTAFLSGPWLESFEAREIPEACLEHVLAAVRGASTPGDAQVWRWIVVRNQEAKRQLEDALPIRFPIHTAPVVLICLADTAAWKSAPKRLQDMVARGQLTETQARDALSRMRDYYSVSPEAAKRGALSGTFVALHHALAAAAECGLSTYWLTEFNETSIKAHFHVPDSFLVATLLPLGYCEAKTPATISHTTSASQVYREKFGEAAAQASGC